MLRVLGREDKKKNSSNNKLLNFCCVPGTLLDIPAPLFHSFLILTLRDGYYIISIAQMKNSCLN